MKFIVHGIVTLALVSCTIGGLLDPILDYIEVGSKDPNDVQFFLYTNPANTDEFDELIFNNTDSVVNSRYNKSNPVILLSHGFTQNYTTQFPVYPRNAYLQAGFANTTNLIVVNWGKLSSAKNNEPFPIPVVGAILDLPLYKEAVDNVYVVGKRVQEFLVWLESNKFLTPGGESIHLLGQSLGAHVSGMAGHYYKNVTRKRIHRITGTDPALPLFEPQLPSLRLDSTSAYFVDVVHTNQGEWGYLGNLGHVDFRVNGGGAVQPECGLANVTDFFCAHNLAPRYYAESILDSTIKACPDSLLGIVPCTTSNEVTFGEYIQFSNTAPRGSYKLDLSL